VAWPQGLKSDVYVVLALILASILGSSGVVSAEPMNIKSNNDPVLTAGFNPEAKYRESLITRFGLNVGRSNVEFSESEFANEESQRSACQKFLDARNKAGINTPNDFSFQLPHFLSKLGGMYQTCRSKNGIVYEAELKRQDQTTLNPNNNQIEEENEFLTVLGKVATFIFLGPSGRGWIPLH
jgi:hypothetical protein